MTSTSKKTMISKCMIEGKLSSSSAFRPALAGQQYMRTWIQAGVKYCLRCAAPYEADASANTSASLGYYRVGLSCLECDPLAHFTLLSCALYPAFVCLIWVLTVYEFKLVSLNILIDFLGYGTLLVLQLELGCCR